MTNEYIEYLYEKVEEQEKLRDYLMSINALEEAQKVVNEIYTLVNKIEQLRTVEKSVSTRNTKKQFRMSAHAVSQLQSLKDHYSKLLDKKVSEADVIHLLLAEKSAAASLPNSSEDIQ